MTLRCLAAWLLFNNCKRVRDPISYAELLFFAVSLNLCYCLKSSPITVDFWQEVQQNE